jgi:hypothetical protein
MQPKPGSIELGLERLGGPRRWHAGGSDRASAIGEIAPAGGERVATPPAARARSSGWREGSGSSASSG